MDVGGDFSFKRKGARRAPFRFLQGNVMEITLKGMPRCSFLITLELGLGVKGKNEIDLREMDLEPALPGFKSVMATVKKAVFGEEE